MPGRWRTRWTFTSRRCAWLRSWRACTVRPAPGGCDGALDGGGRSPLTPAALGGVFVAFSPGLLAHCALAGTDACFTLTSLLALAALARYRQHPSRFQLILLGLTLGLALASKYSAVFLAPAVLVVCAAQS